MQCPSPPPPPPPPPPLPFAHVVSPGGGVFAFLARPGDWAFAQPWPTPGHLTRGLHFAIMEEFIGKDIQFVEDWLVRHGLDKLVDVFKVMFTLF